MPDWLVALPFVSLGLLGLMLGMALLPLRPQPWVVLLPASALSLQAAWSGATPLALGLVLGVALLSALLALLVSCAQGPPRGGGKRPFGLAGPGGWVSVLPGLALALAAIGAWLLALDGRIARRDGAWLLLGSLGYLVGRLWVARSKAAQNALALKPKAKLALGYAWHTLLRRLARLLAALTLIGIAARLLLIGALDLAAVLGLKAHAFGLILGACIALVSNWVWSCGSGWTIGQGPRPWLELGLGMLLGVLALTALLSPGGLNSQPLPHWLWWALALIAAAAARPWDIRPLSWAGGRLSTADPKATHISATQTSEPRAEGVVSKPTLTRIEVCKEYLKFSAAHFTLFAADRRENLHGHDFRVRCAVTAPVGEDGLAFDYGVLKGVLQDLCEELDEQVLLPLHSPYLRIEQQDGLIFAYFADERIPFLERDVVLLPVRNVTAEELAALLLGRLRARPEVAVLRPKAIELGVSSGRGQWAIAQWESA